MKKRRIETLLILVTLLTSIFYTGCSSENITNQYEMTTRQQIETKINEELKSREIKIKSKNTISSLLNFIPPGKALWEMLVGVNDEMEFEKTKITVDELMDLIIALDNKLSGVEEKVANEKISILLEDIIAAGDVTGLEAATSSQELQELLKNPLDITLKNIQSEGNVKGLDLTVDKELKLEKPLKVETDWAKVQFNPEVGEITFGKGLD